MATTATPSHYEVIHCVFDAKVKLFNVRDCALNHYKHPAHPYQLSDKYRFEVYSTTDSGIFEYPNNVPRFVDMENYKEIEKIDLGISQASTIDDDIAKRIIDELGTIADESIWYPENDGDALENAYLKILGDEIYREVINFKYGDIYERCLRADKCYNLLIREYDPDLWESYDMNEWLIAGLLRDHGSVDIFGYLAHDLSFMHPILNGSEVLKHIYERDVHFGKFYHRDGWEIEFVRILKVDEPFTPDKSISEIVKRDVENGKYREMEKEKNEGH